MSDNPHPAHKEILDLLPESLHEIVKPVLKKWDQGVQERFAEIKQEYSGFEPFVKNKVDPKFVEQAVILAHQLQSEPEKVMQQINETWELDWVSKDQIPPTDPPDDEPDDFFNDDVMKHPKVRAMAESLDKLQSKFDETQQEREYREEQEALEQELNELKTKATEENLPWSEEFVTAYMAAGVSGEDALKEYHRVLGQAAVGSSNQDDGKTPPPPNVMGEGGNAGSGSESPTFDVAGSKESVNTFVEDLLKAQAESGQ